MNEQTSFIYLVKDNPNYPKDKNQKKFIKTEVEATTEGIKVFNERYQKGADYNFTYWLFINYKDGKNIPNKSLVKSINATVFTDTL